MKKHPLFGCLALGALFFLSGCGGMQPLAFNAAWYANTSFGSRLDGVSETLEYAVSTHEATGDYSVSYEGTYTTRLTTELKELPSGRRRVYAYSTELKVSARFKLGGASSAPFEDSVSTTAYFLPVSDGLRPLESMRKVVSHVPVEAPYALEENAGYTVQNYTVETKYVSDASGRVSGATLILTEEGKSPETREISVPSSGTFLDNEMLLFALRGLDFSSAFSLRTLDFTGKGGICTVSAALPADVEEEVNFEYDGTQATGKIGAKRLSLAASSGLRGGRRELVYAALTSAQNNTYRNALLRMETPIVYNLGTMVYTLTKAEFNPF